MMDAWDLALEYVRIVTSIVFGLPWALIMDAFYLVGVTIQLLAGFLIGLGPMMVMLWTSLAQRAHNWLDGTSPTPEQGLDQQITALDLQCISWMLQISLDKAVHLSTLKYLVTMRAQVDFDPTPVADCFNIFISCIDLSGCKVVIMQGLEQLATVSVMCLLHFLQHLSIVDPALGVLEDVCQHYNQVLPFDPDFSGLPFYYTMIKIHTLVSKDWKPHYIQWDNYKLSTQEHTSIAQDVVKGAQVEYQGMHGKVPCWILRFALHSLSLDPLPPTYVVANCLSIIAIDLGCDVLNTGTMPSTSDERYVCV